MQYRFRMIKYVTHEVFIGNNFSHFSLKDVVKSVSYDIVEFNDGKIIRLSK